MSSEDILIFVATVSHIINIGLIIIGLQVIFIDVVSDFHIAILSTIYWVPVLLFSPFWGYLADTTGQYRSCLLYTSPSPRDRG